MMSDERGSSGGVVATRRPAALTSAKEQLGLSVATLARGDIEARARASCGSDVRCGVSAFGRGRVRPRERRHAVGFLV